MLQSPFVDPHADPAANDGGIINHEISHYFDDQGRKYDRTGTLTDWSTPADIAQFKALTDRLVAQSSGYEVLPGLHLNGQQTLCENIADLAGITVAYDAYHASLGGRPAPIIDGMTGDQRFFLGFAQAWRTKMRDEALREQVGSKAVPSARTAGEDSVISGRPRDSRNRDYRWLLAPPAT